MTVYAESSAVLAWLLAEPGGERVAPALRPPSPVVVSTLTLIECDRALHRIARRRPADTTAVERLRAQLWELSAGWSVEPIGDAVVARARASFPDDAIRSLDAIHCATAVVIRDAIGELGVLSLDEQIRSNAIALGFRVVPD